MLLIAHPTGNTFSRAAARAFLAVDALAEFDSSFCWDRSSFYNKVLPAKLSQKLSRRAFEDIPLPLQHSVQPIRELLRLVTVDLNPAWLPQPLKHFLSWYAIYQRFDHRVSRRINQIDHLSSVYCYEDASLQTFQQAKCLGLSCIYDLPIGYWRAAQQIFLEEADRKPEWASTIPGLTDQPRKLAHKDEELQLADLVVVPSQFVRSTLTRHAPWLAPSQIAVVPFGSPRCRPIQQQPATSNGPLKVLYVGSLGQRKGLAYLLEAVDLLGASVSLTLIGRPLSHDCAPLRAAMQKHRWIRTLPHQAILEQMSQHDVLVLPSLFEGYALVISEALSQGLAVIATPNSGATESVRDGIEGFIVPIRDPDAIADRLNRLVEDPPLLASMRAASLTRAAQLSWAQSEERLRSVVMPFVRPLHAG
jgi:alpha-maltose-1-phosphate synthase